jgi:hypothetical protein
MTSGEVVGRLSTWCASGSLFHLLAFVLTSTYLYYFICNVVTPFI